MEQSRQETLVAYQREYSELEGLQKAEQVTYALRRGEGSLCFHAKRRTSSAGVCCRFRGLDEAFARLVLCYMYENSVAPEQIPDVLQDLCGSMG